MGSKVAAAFLKLLCLALLSLLLALGGCALPEYSLRQPPEYAVEPMLAGHGRISSFFALKESRAPAVRMEIAEVSVLDNGVWLPITSKPLLIDSEAIADGQIFLGSIGLPQGNYSHLRFLLSKAQLRSGAGEWRELAEVSRSVEVRLVEPLFLEADDSVALFVAWDVASSLTGKGGFVPVLQVSASIRQLPLDLLYVSCPDIDTIFVVRADSNRVVDAFGLKGGPTWLTATGPGGGGFLYVLAARERLVKVVDLSTYRTVDFFPAPLNDKPTFMLLDSTARTAFLVDENSGYVSRMDLRSGNIEARVQLGFQPHFAAYLEQRELLAVSLGLSQKVALLDPFSLQNRGSLLTGGRPQGLLFTGRYLYVAEQDDNTVAVFDVDSGRNLGRVVVGMGPMRLLETDNQIYVSHRSDARLAVLMPGQLTVLREVHDLGRPREMVYNATFHRLYVADEQAGGLGVVDVNANLLAGRVYLGARPFGLAMGQ